MITLTPEQQKRVMSVVEEPTKAALIADDTGFGKTPVALSIVKELKAKTVLVIAPLNTFDGWTRTAEELIKLDMPVKEILAKDKENKVFQELKAGEPGLYLIGREFMHIAGGDAYEKLTQAQVREGRKAKKIRDKRWSWASVNKKIDVVIFDEIHAASNRDSNTHKVLKTIQPRKLKLALSATPGGERFQGLWAVCRWLWPTTTNDKGELYVDRSFWRWAATWAEIGFDPFSTAGKKVLGEMDPGAFVASLPCYFRAEAEKIPTETIRVRVQMTPVQEKQYESMKEHAIAWLRENPTIAELPIVQKIRLRQMLLGEVAFNEDGEIDFPEDMHSQKAEACEKIIAREGPDTPIMFYVDSKRFALRLVERLKEQGYAIEPWTGDQTKEERSATKKRFQEGKTKYIVGTISRALAEGTDGLQLACSTEVWINKAFSSLMNEQLEGRLNRRGQTAEKIMRYEIFVPNSADGEDWMRDSRKTLMRQSELRQTVI